jgi:glycerophosphoryl diester phosphodiesterase
VSLAALVAVAVIGHRGAPAAFPESTLDGFHYALTHGAKAVELDVRISADGIPVVIHDAIVPDRCTGPSNRRVRALTIAQLRKFDCSAADPTFPQQKPSPAARIATLVEVLLLVREVSANGVVLVELKGDDRPDASTFATAVSSAVAHASMEKRVIVESFDVELVRATTLTRGLLVGDDVRGAVDTARSLDCALLSPAASGTTNELVAAAHANNLAVASWTVNDDDTWQRLKSLHVDAIVTDDPARFAQ